MDTIIWTKDRNPHPRVTDTVAATVRNIGPGQITVGHVLWAINCQLVGADEVWQFTSRDVRRVLNSFAKHWVGFRANGHGVYRWETPR